MTRLSPDGAHIFSGACVVLLTSSQSRYDAVNMGNYVLIWMVNVTPDNRIPKSCVYIKPLLYVGTRTQLNLYQDVLLLHWIQLPTYLHFGYWLLPWMWRWRFSLCPWCSLSLLAKTLELTKYFSCVPYTCSYCYLVAHYTSIHALHMPTFIVCSIHCLHKCI